MRAFPLSHASDRPEGAPVPLSVAYSSHRERDDNYRAVVAVLNDRWRVIECRDGIQWILQRWNGTRRGQPQWDGRSYCRTSEGLIRVCRANAGEILPNAIAVLESLPDWMGDRP